MHTQVKWKVLQNIFSSEKGRNREREKRCRHYREQKRESNQTLQQRQQLEKETKG